MLGIRGTYRLTDNEKARIGKYCQKVSSEIDGITTVEINTSNDADFWKCGYSPYWFAMQFSQREFVKNQKKKAAATKVITCKKSISVIRELWNRNKEVFFQKHPPWDKYGIWGSFRERKFNTSVSYEFMDFCDIFLERKDIPYVFKHRVFPRGLFTVLQ
ncbi:MAG: hypothetical protein F9K32_09845 [Desulfobulbaceae bacterium]|nr:MAG: hypothetical protein F9K32_09845 [Desulfobulbaceae bacterium]